MTVGTLPASFVRNVTGAFPEFSSGVPPRLLLCVSTRSHAWSQQPGMSLIEEEGIVVQPSPVCTGYKRVDEKPVTRFTLSALLLDQLQRPG
jgi:hypothetical protein